MKKIAAEPALFILLILIAALLIPLAIILSAFRDHTKRIGKDNTYP